VEVWLSEFLLPEGIMIAGEAVDGFMFAAMIDQIDLLVTGQIELVDRNTACHRLFKNAGGNRFILVLNLFGQGDVNRSYYH
jgi:hypothetical protein